MIEFKNTTFSGPCGPGDTTICRRTGIEKYLFANPYILNNYDIPNIPMLFGGCSQLRSVCIKNDPEYLKREECLAQTNSTIMYANVTDTYPPRCSSLEDYVDYQLSVCEINVGRFVLIYFPDEIISRDLCAKDGFGTAETKLHTSSDMMTAIVENITFGMYQPTDQTGTSMFIPRSSNIQYITLDTEVIPSSVMTGRFTFTSPSAYIAYDKIAALGACPPARSTYTNNIITLHPSEVSSVVRNQACSELVCGGTADFFTTRPFNFADLHGDVPASAYFHTRAPNDNVTIKAEDDVAFLTQKLNSTIVQSAYFPFLALPTQVRDLDPGFSKCLPFQRPPGNVILYHPGYWDPPIVLTPVPVLGSERPSLRPFLVSDRNPTLGYTTESLSPQATALPASRLNEATATHTKDGFLSEETVHIAPERSLIPADESAIKTVQGHIASERSLIPADESASKTVQEHIASAERSLILSDESAMKMKFGTPWIARATPGLIVSTGSMRVETEDMTGFPNESRSFGTIGTSPIAKPASKKSMAVNGFGVDMRMVKILVGLFMIYFSLS